MNMIYKLRTCTCRSSNLLRRITFIFGGSTIAGTQLIAVLTVLLISPSSLPTLVLRGRRRCGSHILRVGGRTGSFVPFNLTFCVASRSH